MPRSEYILSICDENYVRCHSLFVCKQCLASPTMFATYPRIRYGSLKFRLAKFAGIRYSRYMSKYFAFLSKYVIYYICTNYNMNHGKSCGMIFDSKARRKGFRFNLKNMIPLLWLGHCSPKYFGISTER